MTDSTARAKTESKMPPPKLPTADVLVADDPWHPMKTAPKDGSYVFLCGDPCAGKEDGAENHWYWYRTRQFRKGIWQETGWFRRRFGPNCPPSFTPQGWRSVREGMPT